MDAPRTEVVDVIADGLKSDRWSLAAAVAVAIPTAKRNDRGWPTHFVAAQIEGPDFDGEVGLWALGDGGPHQVGPIWAINDSAREYTTWGEAAQPGSRADQNRLHLLGYDEGQLAIRAVAARRST